MNLRSQCSAGTRRGRRRRTAAAVAALWLAMNTLPTVLTLGAWVAVGGAPAHADGEDVWLEPRHAQHDEEDCSRSRDCVFSCAGSQSLLGPPAEHVVARLDPRCGRGHVHTAPDSSTCDARIEPHQPRAPPHAP